MAVGFHRTIRTFRTSRTYNPIESEKEGKITEGTDQYILEVQGDVLLEEQEDIFPDRPSFGEAFASKNLAASRLTTNLMLKINTQK